MQQCSLDTRWQEAARVAFVLMVGCLVPSPLPRYPEFDRFGPDKVLHFLGHGYLTATLVNALAPDCALGKSAVLALGGSTALGVVTAYAQQYVPGRAPERADLVASLCGSLAGLVLWRRLS